MSIIDKSLIVFDTLESELLNVISDFNDYIVLFITFIGVIIGLMVLKTIFKMKR